MPEPASESDPDDLRSTLLAARSALGDGRPHAGLVLAAQADNLASALGDAAGAAEAAALQGHFLFILGRFVEAIVQGTRAFSQCEALDDADAAGDLLAMLAAASWELGLHAEALSFARRAFDMARARAIPHRFGQALALLGGLHGSLGDFDTGEALLLHSLSRARDRHDDIRQMVALNGLMALLIDAHAQRSAAGEEAIALATRARLVRHGSQALRLSGDVARDYRRVVLRSHVAAAFTACGRFADALQLLRHCIEVADAEDMRLVAAKALARQARALMGMNRDEEALDAVRAMLARLDDALLPAAAAEALDLQARLAQRQGDAASAALFFQRLDNLHAQRQRQARALRQDLATNARAVQGALTSIDSEWLDQSRDFARRLVHDLRGKRTGSSR